MGVMKNRVSRFRICVSRYDNSNYASIGTNCTRSTQMYPGVPLGHSPWGGAHSCVTNSP